MKIYDPNNLFVITKNIDPMKTFIYMRKVQLYTFWNRLTFFQKLVLSALLIATMVLLIISLKGADYIFYTVPVLICLFIHLYRKDLSLLKKTGISLYIIYSIEYLILSVPFCLTALFQKKFEYLFFLIIFLFLLQIINFKSKKIL